MLERLQKWPDRPRARREPGKRVLRSCGVGVKGLEHPFLSFGEGRKSFRRGNPSSLVATSLGDNLRFSLGKDWQCKARSPGRWRHGGDRQLLHLSSLLHGSQIPSRFAWKQRGVMLLPSVTVSRLHLRFASPSLRCSKPLNSLCFGT